MTAENRISGMIKEMEQAFAERDVLYKDRDEAVTLQLESLKQRETLLEENDTKQKQTEETLRTLEEDLKKKQEELLAKEKAFFEEKKAYEKESLENREQFREEQIRLNLLQAKLHNEKVRQQTEWIRIKNCTGQAPADHEEETVYTEKEPAIREIRMLREENEELKRKVNELEKLREEDSRCLKILQAANEHLNNECDDLLSEKKELFRKLLEADDILSEKEPEVDEEIKYFQEEADDEEEDPEDETDRTEEFLSCFRKEFPHDKTESFRMESAGKGLLIETDGLSVDVLFEDRPHLEIRIPLEDSRKLRKAIQQINGEGGLECRYERDRKEAVITAPFQEEDGPADVSNLIRCILDYEVPRLWEKGGDK